MNSRMNVSYEADWASILVIFLHANTIHSPIHQLLPSPVPLVSYPR